jgi:hypothetical protein
MRQSYKDLLMQVYELHGPKVSSNGELSTVPPVEFAKLTADDVDRKWDFYDRHLMHEIAKSLARC